jgi:PAS domain-containing protein
MSVPNSVQAACAEGFQPKAMLALQAAALESMPQGVCIVDAEQRVVLFNHRSGSLPMSCASARR